jgi:seryl-tRNA synthetase
MFDLRALRENPEFFDNGWARRGMEPQTPKILELDEKRREIQTQLQDLQAERNTVSKEIGKIKGQGGDADAEMKRVAEIKEQMPELEAQEQKLAKELDEILSALPNIPDDAVPDGADEDSNVEIRTFGEPKRMNDIKDHVDLGEDLGMVDFETAARMSGARFVVLRNGIARLERALGQFMLDVHTQEHGYTELSVPLMVREECMYGTAQLPKFREDQFQTTRGDWLIPTSEVALTNTVREQILDAADLPLRLTSYTPCFRQEAGSAGRDTRGMIRQHQFYKVELVSITTAEQSMDELERMTSCAEEILKRLDIPFRTIIKCIGDTGFSAVKSYDIEAWIPSQNMYREISSCSNCNDFQARRMKARYRKAGEKETQFAHTLNGSGVAVGRALVAVIENYQNADGSINVPKVLQPYMNGLEVIKADETKTITEKAANA